MLFDDVLLSIMPKVIRCCLVSADLIIVVLQSFSTGMFSWFPLFIPLTIPLRVSRGDAVTAHIWRYDFATLRHRSLFSIHLTSFRSVRCVDAKNVWYEWCVSTPEANGSCKVSAIQNVGGKNYYIGL